ncbi:hypothetical protein SMKI_12G4720 [Saccharomyces mikatae IFO 1815]|uniref:RING-type domain-containing protein n=1 Tax=Saccharomyces mikatae IFO 1815 TaxID=226126 RepID=A0AA35IR14_SACMI|nr:uncharacterized protein SMKI_12G4720 [Saccharomyces mikatae IFO 1815]CAI4035321.1 hypothetical protein SMKI_12G4720 [Saccharomyces mikatae IFO 1815]
MVEPDMQKKAGGSGGSELDALNAINNNNKQGAPNNKRNPVNKKKVGNKIPSEKDNTHNYHGQNRRKSNKQQKLKPPYKETTADINNQDIDLSIQEEILGGNFKLRGRKTQVSINHLLNFQLPEVEREKNRSTSGKKLNRRRDEHVHLHGDTFVNVNYRLLVDDRFDYPQQSSDPNIPVDQEKILRVIVPKGQNCSICLSDEPVAPRMVTCGHIFCLSCLLNFFSIEETIKNKETGYLKKKKYKECPLCGSIIGPKRVKPVLYEDDFDVARLNEKPEPGATVYLQLMCKPHGSLLPLPVTLNLDPLKCGNFPPASLGSIKHYAHIMKCGVSFSLDLYQKDIVAIQEQYEIDKAIYNDSGKFVKRSIENINDQISTLLTATTNLSPLSDDINSGLDNFHFDDDLLTKYDDTSAFFFYQTLVASSTKYFLSPLDVKILLTIFHSYSKFPGSIEATIENIHYDTVVTEQLIRRYKYISHLPIGTEIALLDLDWRRIPFLPKDIYEQFAHELKQRRRKFTMKKQKEDKEKKLYEKKLEQEHAEFYRKENGNSLKFEDSVEMATHYESMVSSSVPLNSLGISVLGSPRNTCSNPQKNKHSHTERTIWGTSIAVTEDEKASKENKEFQDMLLQRIRQEDSSDATNSTCSSLTSNGRRGKKKKGKVMLFSSNHQALG